jgi:hypothetical protein
MFGRMMVEPVVQLGPGVDLRTAVAALIKVAENVEIVRWIELPTSVLLFLLVPGDPHPLCPTLSVDSSALATISAMKRERRMAFGSSLVESSTSRGLSFTPPWISGVA